MYLCSAAGHDHSHGGSAGEHGHSHGHGDGHHHSSHHDHHDHGSAVEENLNLLKKATDEITSALTKTLTSSNSDEH